MLIFFICKKIVFAAKYSDAAHREKIVRCFFNELDGQVFIFSTDKEIVREDIELLKPKLGKTFLLKNDGANERTAEL